MINTKNNPIFSTNPAQKLKELAWIKNGAIILAILLFVFATIESTNNRVSGSSQSTPVDLCSFSDREINEMKAIRPPNCPETISATTQIYLEELSAPTPTGDFELPEGTSAVNPKPEPEPTPAPAQTQSNGVASRSYKLNNGTHKSGADIISYVRSNPNGEKLYQSFLQISKEEADKSAITLFYENGTLWEKTVGVCNPIHWIGGDYRNCAYADINSNGLDVGLIQVNTWYQRHRIMRLSGINCTIQATRDRNDPCNAQLIAWLHNVDNNILIAREIHSESGWTPWYGAHRSFLN
jgi:hypothetical protein